MPEAPGTRTVRAGQHTELWLFAALTVVGTAIGLFITRHGVAITDDSHTYIGAARNLADGKGFTVPYSNVLDNYSPLQAAQFHGKVPLLLFPPFFSVLLAPFERVGIASTDALRLLNPLMLGASLGLLGLLAYRMTRSIPLAVAGAVLAMHAYVLQLFGFVQSEPLYFVLSLLALLLLTSYLESGRRNLLVGFAVAAALACLTRVVGISLVAAGAIALVAWSPGPIRRRLVRAATVAAASVIPLVVFLVYGSLAAGPGHRPIGWHPPSRGDYRAALSTIDRLLVPLDPFGALSASDRLLAGLALAVVVVVVIALAWGGGRAENVPDSPGHAEPANRFVLPVLAIYLGCYLAELVATRTVTYASSVFQFGGRLLIPAQPIAWLVVLGVVARFARNRLRPATARRVLGAVGVLAIVVAGIQLARASDIVFGWPDGPGVNPPVAASPTLELLRRYPTGTLVVTNDPGHAWFDDGIDAVSLPAATVPLSEEPNGDINREISQLRSLLRARDGLVVYVDGPYLTTFDLVHEDRLKAALPLREIARTADGRIYKLDKG
jgi:hypothetical protein